jgi:hypothetical protein
VNHPAEGEEFVTLSALAAFLHLRLNERERAVRLAHNDPRLVAMLREYVHLGEMAALTAGDALRALGTQWSGHPSYLPEWAPLSPEVDHTERRGL